MRLWIFPPPIFGQLWHLFAHSSHLVSYSFGCMYLESIYARKYMGYGFQFFFILFLIVIWKFVKPCSELFPWVPLPCINVCKKKYEVMEFDNFHIWAFMAIVLSVLVKFHCFRQKMVKNSIKKSIKISRYWFFNHRQSKLDSFLSADMTKLLVTLV